MGSPHEPARVATFLDMLHRGDDAGMLGLIFSLDPRDKEDRKRLLAIKKRFWADCACPLAPLLCACDQSRFRFTWSMRAELAVEDLAEGRWNDERICRTRDVEMHNLLRWKRHPEFLERIRDRIAEIEAETGIPRREELQPLVPLRACGCPVRWRPCKHMPDEPLPLDVASFLLLWLNPGHYDERPEPPDPSDLGVQDECARVAKVRVWSGFAPRHPLDYRQRVMRGHKERILPEQHHPQEVEA